MESKNIVKSVEKALFILDCFKDIEEIGFNELGKLTGLPNGTLFRIISTLINRDYIYKDASTGLYRLGKKISILGLAAIRNLNFHKIIHSLLQDIARDTRETANAAINVNNEIVYIDIVESPQAIKMLAKIGSRDSIHSTSLGKVLLAFMEKKEQDIVLEKIELVKKTENTITKKETLKREVKNIVKNGYAVDNEENELGCKCIAVPVFDQNKKVVGEISISGPIDRINENLEELIKKIMKYGMIASNQLGYYL